MFLGLHLVGFGILGCILLSFIEVVRSNLGLGWVRQLIPCLLVRISQRIPSLAIHKGSRLIALHLICLALVVLSLPESSTFVAIPISEATACLGIALVDDEHRAGVVVRRARLDEGVDVVAVVALGAADVAVVMLQPVLPGFAVLAR